MPLSKIGPACARFLTAISLKTRVVLLVMLMLVAGVWALAFGVMIALQRDITQMLAASLSSEVAYVAADLDREIQLQVDALDRLAASLGPEIQADPAKLHRALDRFADWSAVVPSSCYTVDRHGIVTAGYPESAVRLGTSVRDRTYFRQAMSTGRPAIGSPAAAPGARPQAALPIAVPLRGRSGAPEGALIGDVLLSEARMFNRLEQTRLGKGGYFLVVSPTDRMILSAPDPDRILKRLPPKGMLKQLDRRLEEGFEGAGISMTAPGFEQLGVGRKMATTGWMVLAGVPTREIFAPIEAFKQRVYLAALAISLGAAVILYFFLARELAPLKQAGRAMRRMTAGEVPMAPIPVARHDEIGELIGQFNRLVAERSRLEESLQQEIAERKQANEALRESRDRLESIYLSVGDGIISIDERQRIVAYNAAAERMFGYPAREMLGQPLGMLLPERFRGRHEGQVQRFGATGASERTMGKYGIIHGLRAGGEEFPVEATLGQSGVSPNKTFTVILRDITERRRAERAREALTRQLELLSERLVTLQEDERRKVAHELHEQLGQELTTLQMYLHVLGGGAEVQTHRDTALAVTAQAIGRVRKLVPDLDPPDLEELGLRAALRAHCERRAAAARLRLHLELGEAAERPPRAVERACFRVVQEALGNVLSHAAATEVRVSLEQGADSLEISVRDDGVGFDPAVIATEKEPESGSLGLLGTRMRVRHAGGELAIESAPGRGTEIRARFSLTGVSPA